MRKLNNRKSLIKTLLMTAGVFVLVAFVPNKLSTQNDDLSGIYVDNIKVDSINCFNFEKLKVVFPLKERDKWNKYDLIEVDLFYNNENSSIEQWTYHYFVPANLIDYFPIDAAYGVWTVFDKKPVGFTNGGQSGYSKLHFAQSPNKPDIRSRYFQLKVVGSFAVDKRPDNSIVYGRGVVLYQGKKIPIIQCYKKFGYCYDEKATCKNPGKKIELKLEPAGSYSEELEIIK